MLRNSGRGGRWVDMQDEVLADKDAHVPVGSLYTDKKDFVAERDEVCGVCVSEWDPSPVWNHHFCRNECPGAFSVGKNRAYQYRIELHRDLPSSSIIIFFLKK